MPRARATATRPVQAGDRHRRDRRRRRRSHSARPRSTSCAAAAARRRCSRTPRTPCATEALEIATYTAIEQLARSVGDDRDRAARRRRSAPTSSGCSTELMNEIPKLTDAVVRADVRGDGTYDVATTGAGETARPGPQGRAARRGGTTARRTARKARRDARGGHRPWRRRRASRTSRSRATTRSTPRRSSARLTEPLAGRPRQGRDVRAQERRTARRSPTGSRTLRTSEPWSGYDEQSVDEIRSALGEGRRRARPPRAHVRARAQGPRGRDRGDRARARQRVVRQRARHRAARAARALTADGVEAARASGGSPLLRHCAPRGGDLRRVRAGSSASAPVRLRRGHRGRI